MSRNFQYTKQFNFFTDKEIEEQLKKSDYKHLYKWFDTDIPNDNSKLIRPSNNFEDKLEKEKIYYFAYIKFFKMDNQLYGIVAGKTKSKLVNIKDKKRAQELQMICMSLRIRVRLIKKEEYFQTVGVLAGMKEASETDRIYEGEELADEMMVFAGVTGSHLDQILFMMRKKGMKRIDYKAVLTDTNSQWTVPELFKELEKEHAAMHQS